MVPELYQEPFYYGLPRFVAAAPSWPHFLAVAFHARKSVMIINQFVYTMGSDPFWDLIIIRFQKQFLQSSLQENIKKTLNTTCSMRICKIVLITSFKNSEKATQFEKNIPSYYTLLSKIKSKKWDIFSKRCSILRISEL